jgi:hypothetical protein
VILGELRHRYQIYYLEANAFKIILKVVKSTSCPISTATRRSDSDNPRAMARIASAESFCSA